MLDKKTCFKKEKDLGANHPYLQPVAVWRMQINVAKVPLVAIIRPVWPQITAYSLHLHVGVVFYGGRKIGEPGEKPSKHGRDKLQQLYSHDF